MSKNKKPIYKRAWFWAVAVIVVAGTAGGSDTDNSKETNSGNIESVQEVSQSNNEISQIITTNGNLLGNMGEMGINNGYNQRVIGTNKANGGASSNLVINDEDTLQNGYISYQMSNEGINENITPEGVLLNHDSSNQLDSSFSEEVNNDVYRGTTSDSNTKDNLRGSSDYYLKYLSSLSVICLGLVLLV